MAKLYISKTEITSKIAWFYVLQTNAPVDVYEFNDDIEELRKINPLGVLPFLSDGDIRVWGSLTIIIYVAEHYTNFQGLGKTLEERSKAESIISWANGTLLRSVIHSFVIPQIDKDEGLTGELNTSLIETGKELTKEQLDVLENTYFKTKRFFLGDEPYFVDHYVGIILAALDSVKFDVASWPKTSVWLAHMKTLYNDFIDKKQ